MTFFWTMRYEPPPLWSQQICQSIKQKINARITRQLCVLCIRPTVTSAFLPACFQLPLRPHVWLRWWKHCGAFNRNERSNHSEIHLPIALFRYCGLVAVINRRPVEFERRDTRCINTCFTTEPARICASTVHQMQIVRIRGSYWCRWFLNLSTLKKKKKLILNLFFLRYFHMWPPTYTILWFVQC